MKKRVWKKKVKAALAVDETRRFAIPARGGDLFYLVAVKRQLWLSTRWPLHLAMLLERRGDLNRLICGGAWLLWQRASAPRNSTKNVMEGKA